MLSLITILNRWLFVQAGRPNFVKREKVEGRPGPSFFKYFDILETDIFSVKVILGRT